jgi:outer membrane receptor for ferrienterochelin and colicin
VEFSYRHSLTFLPHWARGIQVFANGTFLDLKGSTLADFSGYAERDLSWGATLSRPRYSVKLNWSSNGEVRGRLIAESATVPSETYFYTPRRTTLDASFEFRVHPKWSIYGTARNVFDRRVSRLRVGPGVPSYAQNERYNEPGAFCTLGIKGQF